MAYTKQNWENLPSTNTPITAERLSHMEDGIYDAWEHGGGGETLPVGSEIEFDGLTTDIPTGWEQVNDITKKIWENTSPTESFSSQTVAVDLSNYDSYSVIWAGSTSLANVFNTGAIPTDSGTSLNQSYYGTALTCRERAVSIASTGLAFGDGKANGSTNNGQCIPLYIIGHNIGLGVQS